MSFFDSVSSFFDGVSSFFSSVKDTVSDFLSDVSEKIANFVEDFGPVINLVCIATTVAVMVLFPELDVAGIVMVITNICDLVSKLADSTMEEPARIDAADLGMRAEQSDKKPEDFDNYNDYIEHLTKNIQIDKEKMENLSAPERMAYSLAGLGIREQQISENLRANIPAETYVDAYKAGMSSNELKGMIDYLAENKDELPRLGDYFNGETLNSEEQQDMRMALHEAIKETDLAQTEDAIENRIFEIKEAYQKEEATAAESFNAWKNDEKNAFAEDF